MPHNRRAFTLIELLVVISVIALLVSILLPSLTGAMDLAKTTVCMTNLRQVGFAAQMYAQQNHDLAVPYKDGDGGNQWPVLLGRTGFIQTAFSTDPDVIPDQDTPFGCPAGEKKVTNNWTWFPQTAPFEPVNRHAVAHPGFDKNDNPIYQHCWFQANGATWTKGWPIKTQMPQEYEYAAPRFADRTMVFYDGRNMHNVWVTTAQDANVGHTIVRMTSARHSRGRKLNSVFVDGHAGTIRIEDMPDPWSNLPKPYRLRGWWGDD